MSGTLKLASKQDAFQMLADILGKRVVIAAITPDPGDIVVVLHPKENKFYTFEFPKLASGGPGEDREGGAVFTEKDLIKNPMNLSQPLTFKGSDKLEQIALFLDALFGVHAQVEKRKQIRQQDIKSFYLAETIPSDKDVPAGDISFGIKGGQISTYGRGGKYKDRKYHAMSSSVGALVSEAQRIKDREEEEKRMKEEEFEKMKKRVKKNPARAKKVRKKFTQTEESEATLPSRMYGLGKASKDELIQFLADKTGCKILIEE